MTAPNSTIKKLAEIADPAFFERLATDVLRACDPSKYGSLSHPGVNPEGKTVKAPLDGIGWVRDSGGERFIGAAHSTARQDDIQKKWLHDPSTVKPRRAHKSPTAPEGDLRKAIREIRDLRASHPTLHATLALTSNREPDLSALTAAQSLASTCNIELDIWSASRIAQFLDSPEGQCIRKIYLGDPVEYVSTELLASCTQRCLKEYADLLNPSELVDRTDLIDQANGGHSMLLGPSGVGKTTLSLQILKLHAEKGGFGLVIPHETVDKVTSLAEAIDVELRKLEPFLSPNSGHSALSLTSAGLPFLVVIEDANRANDPTKTFNKVVEWALKKEDEKEGHSWRLLCPIWPRYIDSLHQKWKNNQRIVWQTIGSYTDKQAEDAIRKKGKEAGHRLWPATITAIAKALGNDPLLIALSDFSSTPDPAAVIETYVRNELANVAAASSSFQQTDMVEATDNLLRYMLRNRRLNPSLKEIKEWFAQNSEQLNVLRLIFKSGSVLRLTHRNDEDVLTSRHDRVLLSLLGQCIGRDLQIDALDDSYLSDPFFAEAIGSAIVSRHLETGIIERIMRLNPLVLFHAFHVAVRVNSQTGEAIADVITAWLAQPESLGQRFRSLRFRALSVLAEIDSPKVLALTVFFPDENRYYSWYQARFRNGDLEAGFRLLTMFGSLGVTVPGREELLAHIFAHFGLNLIEPLQRLLSTQELDSTSRKGGLLLAGYLGAPALAQAIHSSWSIDKFADYHLEEYLWAAARCYDGIESNTLRLICDAWAEIPDDESSKRSRSQFAAYGLSWEFRRYLPSAAIPFFVEMANADERLAWPITYMMRDFDHPLAVEHIARFLADRDRNSESGSMDLAHFSLLDGWKRQQREQGLPMSPAVKDRLLGLVLNAESDIFLRRNAFSVWEATQSQRDLEQIQNIERDSDLYERAIWARARRKDKTVIPQLLELIRSRPDYWWQAGRYLWSAEMTQELHRSITIVAERLKSQPTSALGLDWILSELLMEIDGQSAEKILIEEWDGLKHSAFFVQAAIYFASPLLAEKAKEAVKQANDPAKLFEHVTGHMGWRWQGRTGITTIKQVELLCEFADYLPDHEIHALWEICNKYGWTDFRKSHLDGRLSQTEHFAKRNPSEIDVSVFDSELAGRSLGGTAFWFDQYLREGHTVSALMDALFDWLDKNRTVPALRLLAEIFYTSARRCDLDRIIQYTEGWPEAQEVVADFSFAVRYRTLE